MDWPVWSAAAALLLTAATLIWRAGQLEGNVTSRLDGVEARFSRYITNLEDAKLDQRLSRVEAKLEMLSELIMQEGEHHPPRNRGPARH